MIFAVLQVVQIGRGIVPYLNRHCLAKGDKCKSNGKVRNNGRKYHKNTVRQVTIKTACRNFPKIAIEENNFRSVVKLCKSATGNAPLGNTNFNGQTTICNNGKTRSINIKIRRNQHVDCAVSQPIKKSHV